VDLAIHTLGAVLDHKSQVTNLLETRAILKSDISESVSWDLAIFVVAQQLQYSSALSFEQEGLVASDMAG
jgi:hypothetical protein